MFWLLLPVLLFFVLLMWLLWAPLRLVIDTEQAVFRLEWRSIGCVAWLPEQALDLLEVRVLFFRRRLQLGETGRPKPEKRQEKKRPTPKRKGKSLSPKRLMRLAINVLRSFRVRRFHLIWDTDDFVRNAWFFPPAAWVSARGWPVQINFQGRRELALIVENRLARVVWAVLKTFFTK